MSDSVVRAFRQFQTVFPKDGHTVGHLIRIVQSETPVDEIPVYHLSDMETCLRMILGECKCVSDEIQQQIAPPKEDLPALQELLYKVSDAIDRLVF